MILQRDPGNRTVAALGGNNATVQTHCHPRLRADLVQHQLVEFRIEGQKHAAKTVRPGNAAELTQPADHLVGHAEHHLARLRAQRVQAAIGQHIAHGGRPAQTAGSLDQQDARTGLRRANGRADAARPAAGDDDIVVYRHRSTNRSTRVRIALTVSPSAESMATPAMS